MSVNDGKEQILENLNQTWSDIDAQIQDVKNIAKELGCEPSEIRDSAGNYLMTPLICARAHLILAESMLRMELK